MRQTLRRLMLPLVALVASAAAPLPPEDGYELWLRYRPVADAALQREYRGALGAQLVAPAATPTQRVVRDELLRGLGGLLGGPVAEGASVTGAGALLVGTPASSPAVAGLGLAAELRQAGPEGFVLRWATVEGRRVLVLAANTDVGTLYGAFHLLRALQTQRPLPELATTQSPRIRLRVLNHWDNLDRTVERGFAGQSLWDWHRLPHHRDARLRDYARANASLGINGTVLTNVNANAVVLSPQFLPRVAALAEEFRPYGIRVYLTARFNAPMELGGLRTADPLDPAVRAWWKSKVDEIYRHVPDFGGFLVKANSEGQPGPQDYRRSHADGANMLAEALAPHGGVVMWRAFVYSAETPTDRVKQAYDEFKPLDGTFLDNVFVQVKNGPLDFQPREPFHPLFGGMPRTPLMMEFQVTKEYLGFSTWLAYLGTLWEETLDAETFARGAGSTVARVIDGSLEGHARSGIAGVANIGTDRNWTGGHFAQADWYAYGRLAWDHSLSAEAIADEWIRQTFANDPSLIAPVKQMMMVSREAVVNYTGALGLHHLFARNHHYGPGPWVEGGGRADWTSVYYHRADSLGIGFDRSAAGSNALEQYADPIRRRWGNRATVPDSLLLWFHRVRWNERLAGGRTLWDELVHRYHAGVDTVRGMRRTWAGLEGRVDPQRFRDISTFLRIQEEEAVWWRDASTLYFQQFSRMPIPAGLEQPAHDLEYYRTLQSRYVPGI